MKKRMKNSNFNLKDVFPFYLMLNIKAPPLIINNKRRWAKSYSQNKEEASWRLKAQTPAQVALINHRVVLILHLIVLQNRQIIWKKLCENKIIYPT